MKPYITIKSEGVDVECVQCHTVHTLGDVSAELLEEWEGGELIQRVFPTMPEAWREMLVSGICPTCWDRIFDGDELDEGPTCSICDGAGHGYVGGPPCPLETADYSGEPWWAL